MNSTQLREKVASRREVGSLPPAPIGRPKREFDLATVYALGQLHCTLEEIAHFFKCSPETLTKYKGFEEAKANGEALGKRSLRRAMLQTALDGSVPMQIWLSKNGLGMKAPKQDVGVGGQDGGPIRIVFELELPRSGEGTE